MKLRLGALAIPVSFAAAQNWIDSPSTSPGQFIAAGTLQAGQVVTAAATELYRNASRDSPDSNTVTFERSFNDTPEAWKWRVSLSEIDVPDALPQLGQPNATNTVGRQLTNNQWELTWPGSEGGNKSLQALLDARGVNMTLLAMQISLPRDRIEQFNQAGNGDCSSLLNDTCREYLASGYFTWGVTQLSSCFGSTYTDKPYINRPLRSSIWSTRTPLLYPGDPLLFMDSFPYTTNDSRTDTLYTFPTHDDFLGALNLLIIDFVPGVVTLNPPPPSDQGRTILCQVINKSKAPAPESAAPSVRAGLSSFVALLVTAVVTLVVMG